MNAVADRTDQLVESLRAWSGKMSVLNGEISSLLANSYWNYIPQQLAWLLDRAEAIDEPVRRLVNHTAARLEHNGHDVLTELELKGGLSEAEAQYHHLLMLAEELRTKITGYSERLAEKVKSLRVAAGLNAMKGGPLRPND